MISASAAQGRLREGNRRFVTAASHHPALTGRDRRESVSAYQEPFAIILGCSDSRVPAELVFDQGIGDLFVIRVAGNIVAPSQIGSVEFAADQFGTRLVVVMGHTRCGGVIATLDWMRNPEGHRSPNVGSIVDLILPSVQNLEPSGPDEEPEAFLGRAVRANIRASVDRLRTGSEILKHLIAAEGLRVVGAEYCLEAGTVEFFDEA